MNENQVKRAVQSVGMKCFVEHFERFSDDHYNNSDLIDFLRKEENWQENGCRTRVNQARRILKEGKAQEALQQIVDSNKADIDLKLKATHLLEELETPKYISAFKQLKEEKSKLIQKGFEYIIAHSQLPECTGSTNEISKKLGKPIQNATYGKFAHKIYELIEYKPTILEKNRKSEWLVCITDLHPNKNKNGEYQLILKRSVYNALLEMGLIQNSEQNFIDNELKERLPELNTLQEKTRVAVIQARLGQGKFRQSLIDYWRGCSVTGFSVYELLIASHIKPWRASSIEECLSVKNGLLLTPDLDKAFDLGFISFDDNGKIIKSSRLSPSQFEFLGIHKDMKLRKLCSEHCNFLKFHRIHIFKD